MHDNSPVPVEQATEDGRPVRMEMHDLYALFEIIAGFDTTFNRIVDPREGDFERQQRVVKSWYSVLATVPFEFAERAVREHYRHRSEHLTPNVLYSAWADYADTAARELDKERARATKARAERNSGSTDVRNRARAGLLVGKGYSWQEALAEVEARTRKLSVTCPACGAKPGKSCTARGARVERTIIDVHASRMDAVRENQRQATESGRVA